MDKNRARPGRGARSALLGPGLCALLYEEPLLKAAVLGGAVQAARVPVAYLDFDLMYSGCAANGLVGRAPGARVIRPRDGGVCAALGEALATAAGGRCLVVVDSLNGMMAALRGRDSGRAANAYVMLLASVARGTGSSVVVAAAAGRSGAGWALRPTSRPVLAARWATTVALRAEGGRVRASVSPARPPGTAAA